MRKIIDFLFIGEYQLNWLRTVIAILGLTLLIGITYLIVHEIRYKCIRGHYGWIHNAKVGYHWGFICDEEVLKSDTTKHIIYDKCNCNND